MQDDDDVRLAGVTFFQPLAVIASSISVSTRRWERSLPHVVPIAIA